MEERQNKKGAKVAEFFLNVLRGVCIGVAFIIPGFSGGSIAAILGIYERLVGAIADIFKQFKKSILFLLPIGLGMVLGIMALMFPLQWALANYPIPTVCLFVGLALGGMPSVTEKIKKPRFLNVFSVLIPLALAAALSFLPLAGEVDLFALKPFGYVMLFVIGVVGSCALVIPGISGSMLLLIFGYYNPIVRMITGLIKGQHIGTSLLVLGLVGAGIIVGFFLISVIMKWLLKTHPRGTYCAIAGFILGSIPTVFISTVKDAGLTVTLFTFPLWYWLVCAILLFVGVIIAYGTILIARKASEKRPRNESEKI